MSQKIEEYIKNKNSLKEKLFQDYEILFLRHFQILKKKIKWEYRSMKKNSAGQLLEIMLILALQLKDCQNLRWLYLREKEKLLGIKNFTA